MNATSDLTLKLLGKGLDAMSARQTAISNNMANVETPNYKAVGVAFEDSLRQAIRSDTAIPLAQTDNDHLNAQGKQAERMENVEARIFRRNDTSMRKDGNNVDVEAEMIGLAETGLRFQTMTQLATKKLALMRMVIQEGR